MRISERLPTPELAPHSFMERLSRARRGDRRALDELAARYYEAVRDAVHAQLAADLRSSRPWLASRFSTGDVVQEVFDSVLYDLESFRGTSEDAFCGYLAMVVRNRIIDAIRHHQAMRRDGRLSEAIADDDQDACRGTMFDPELSAERREARECVSAAMGSLDERTRLLVRARIEGTGTFAQLSEQLGYGSESSARRVFADAYARLAVELRALRDTPQVAAR